MNFDNIKYKANYYVLLILAFVIPLERKLAAPLIILFFISSLFNGNYKLKKKKTLLYFSVLFIIYLLGLLYSENLKYGLSDIETKLSLIVFPIAFYISKIDFNTKINNVLISFIDGCFVAGIITLINAFIQFYFTQDISYFFYGKFALFTHPGYASMFLSFALIIIYYQLLSKEITVSLQTLKSFLLIIFFTIIIFLYASKTGIISMLFIHITSIIYWIVKSKLYLKGGIVLVIFCFLFVLTYNNSLYIKGRIDEMFTAVLNDNNKTLSTTNIRLEIWNTSFNLIKKKPIIGYGTGDVKDTLISNYKSLGLVSFADKNLNTHNQFLQTTIALGLIGGLTLLLSLLFPLFMSFKNYHLIYVAFLLLIFFNFLTEAVIERVAGVIFYAFFNSLFFAAYFNKQQNNF